MPPVPSLHCMLPLASGKHCRIPLHESGAAIRVQLIGLFPQQRQYVRHDGRHWWPIKTSAEDQCRQVSGCSLMTSNRFVGCELCCVCDVIIGNIFPKAYYLYSLLQFSTKWPSLWQTLAVSGDRCQTSHSRVSGESVSSN